MFYLLKSTAASLIILISAKLQFTSETLFMTCIILLIMLWSQELFCYLLHIACLEICYNFEIFFQCDCFCSQTWWIQLAAAELVKAAEHLLLLNCTPAWLLWIITHVAILYLICALCLVIWIISSSIISSLMLFLLQIKLNFNSLWKITRIFYNC